MASDEPEKTLAGIGRYAWDKLGEAGHEADERDLIIGMFVGASMGLAELASRWEDQADPVYQECARQLRRLTG